MKTTLQEICNTYLENKSAFERLVFDSVAFTELPPDEQFTVIEEAIECGVKGYIKEYTPKPDHGCAYDTIAHELQAH